MSSLGHNDLNKGAQYFNWHFSCSFWFVSIALQVPTGPQWVQMQSQKIMKEIAIWKNPTNFNILAFKNAQGVNASTICAVDHVAYTILDG